MPTRDEELLRARQEVARLEARVAILEAEQRHLNATVNALSARHPFYAAARRIFGRIKVKVSR